MPIKVQNNLPAKHILETENIFVMDEKRADSQNIRPLKIVILNLMPLKEDTELDLLRVLSNFPIQTEITLMKLSSYNSTHTSSTHLNAFYVEFKDIEKDYFDGGLFHHYGIEKRLLEKKLSGVYKHRVLHRKKMLMRGMDDEFYVPQSRYTGLDEEALRKNKELYVVADSEECGSYLILACSSRQIFVTGHSEYDRYDLDKEYKRDLLKGLNPDIPVNYYPENNPEKTPVLSWRSGSNCIYSNWLNFVYQETPYNLEELRPVSEDSYLRDNHWSERDGTVSPG